MNLQVRSSSLVPDPRVAAELDRLGINYRCDDDGDFLVGFSFGEEDVDDPLPHIELSDAPESANANDASAPAAGPDASGDDCPDASGELLEIGRQVVLLIIKSETREFAGREMRTILAPGASCEGPFGLAACRILLDLNIDKPLGGWSTGIFQNSPEVQVATFAIRIPVDDPAIPLKTALMAAAAAVIQLRTRFPDFPNFPDHSNN